MTSNIQTIRRCHGGVPLSFNSGRWVVAGLGKTGLSVARFLTAGGADVVAFDTRTSPPNLDLIRRELPLVDVYAGAIPELLLHNIDGIVVSPGIALQLPLLEKARQLDIPIVGDIEIFAHHAAAPYVAITGSNGKSTVTTLVAEIIAADGRVVKAGANLGIPALDLLTSPPPSCYVLELSSFQLESTFSLTAEVACILNVTADHLDRHKSLDAYINAKARILDNALRSVINADDPLVAHLGRNIPDAIWISLREDAETDYGIVSVDGRRYLRRANLPFMPVSEIQIKGTHNEFNALAAIAITDCIGVSPNAQRLVLARFPGLEHRCRLVAEQNGIRWFNDSKGTNIGASAAAISGIFADRTGVLIAGGQGKGADFTALRPVLQKHVHSVVLIGEDAGIIEAAINDIVQVVRAIDMPDAVEKAARAAQSGEAVLLSPACASFDMFANYEARGYAFETAVKQKVLEA